MKTNCLLKKIYYKVILFYVGVTILFIPLKTIHPQKHHADAVSQSLHHKSFTLLPPPIIGEFFSITSLFMLLKGFLAKTIPAAFARFQAYIVKRVSKKILSKITKQVKINVGSTLETQFMDAMKGNASKKVVLRALHQERDLMTTQLIKTKRKATQDIVSAHTEQVYGAEVQTDANLIAYAIAEETSHYIVDKLFKELGSRAPTAHKKSITTKLEALMKKMITSYLKYKKFRMDLSAQFQAYTWVKKGTDKIEPIKTRIDTFTDKFKKKFKEKIINPIHKRTSQKMGRKMETYIQQLIETALQHTLGQRITKRIEEIVGKKVTDALTKRFTSLANHNIKKNQNLIKNRLNANIIKQMQTTP